MNHILKYLGYDHYFTWQKINHKGDIQIRIGPRQWTRSAIWQYKIRISQGDIVF